MITKRALFTADLGVLLPAIADKSKIPGLECLWFSGDKVSAYNDLIGIEKSVTTDFVGGVPGKLLYGYLNSLSTDEVKIEQTKDLNITTKSSKLKLPIKPIEEQPWQLPEFEQADYITLTKEFLALLDLALISVNKNSMDEEQMGITLEVRGRSLIIYSTDAATISRAEIARPSTYNLDRVTIPGDFFNQLLKLCIPEDKLYISENAAVAINPAGTKLFGRVLEVANPRDFEAIINRYTTDTEISIPVDLDKALDRARLLVFGKDDTVMLHIMDNVLGVYLKSDLGEIREVLEIEPVSNKAEAHFDPELVKRALPERAFFALTDDCLTLTGPDGFIHIISPRAT